MSTRRFCDRCLREENAEPEVGSIIPVKIAMSLRDGNKLAPGVDFADEDGCLDFFYDLCVDCRVTIAKSLTAAMAKGVQLDA